MSVKPVRAQDKRSAALHAMMTGAPHREIERLLVEAAAESKGEAAALSVDRVVSTKMAAPERINSASVQSIHREASTETAAPELRATRLIPLIAPVGAACFVYATGGGIALALTIGLAVVGGFIGAHLGNDRMSAVFGAVVGFATVGSIAGYIVFAAFGIRTTGGFEPPPGGTGEPGVCYRGVCD